jgi:hypothetical protein
MKRLFTLVAAISTLGCASAPGSSALGGPESRLVSFARGLNIRPASRHACPGELFAATYEVRIDGGTVLPLTESDVADLVRRAVGAEPARNGGWLASADALASAYSGFRLSAALRRDTTVRGDTVVIPSYECRRTQWQTGPIGRFPDTQAFVRLGTLATPFYDSVVVAVLEVAGRLPSVTILGPNEMRRGTIHVDAAGVNGAAGRAGGRGDPGAECADGGDGQDGDFGRDGDPGGEIDIIVQTGSEWLADLVSVSNPGGHGGAGGAGGGGWGAGPSAPWGEWVVPSESRPARSIRRSRARRRAGGASKGHVGADGAPLVRVAGLVGLDRTTRPRRVDPVHSQDRSVIGDQAH